MSSQHCDSKHIDAVVCLLQYTAQLTQCLCPADPVARPAAAAAALTRKYSSPQLLLFLVHRFLQHQADSKELKLELLLCYCTAAAPAAALLLLLLT